MFVGPNAADEVKRVKRDITCVLVGSIIGCLLLTVCWLAIVDPQKPKPIETEVRVATALQQSNEITERLIAELRKCYPEGK